MAHFKQFSIITFAKHIYSPSRALPLTDQGFYRLNKCATQKMKVHSPKLNDQSPRTERAGSKRWKKGWIKVKERGLLSGHEEKRPASSWLVTTSAEGPCSSQTDKVIQGRDEVKSRLITPIRARTPSDRPVKFGKHMNKTIADTRHWDVRVILGLFMYTIPFSAEVYLWMGARIIYQ